MTLHRWIGYSAAAVVGGGAILTSVISTQATMLPIYRYAAPSYIQAVDCALGAHIGPVGGCILGTDDPRPVVVERPVEEQPANNGCETKSETRTDAAGNSVTKTKTNC